ncbi:MAG: CHAT domain-containing protein, partial [Gammaproteobacteria bacterium]
FRSLTTALNASMDKLLPWLRSNPDAQLIHFSVHGKWGNTGIKDGIGLVDGKMLDPSVVRQSKLVGHPFIFLNACQVGQGQTVLGDYGGMAEAFLKAGAAAVVAPLWSVDDESANAVAERFYAAIDSGKNPGELVRRERLNFVAHPTSATSLAYQFFGHPAMRMALNVERRSNSQ